MSENTTYTLVKYAAGDNSTVTGSVTFDATAITAADYVEIDVGFKPRVVEWDNITGVVGIKHYQGMTANTCLKSAAAGGNTIETTNGGITLTARGFRVTQNATLVAILASQVCYFKATA